MNRYKISIVETLIHKVEVEAENESKALKAAEHLYYDSNIVLNSEDFSHVGFRLG